MDKSLQSTINHYSPFLYEVRKRLLFLFAVFALASSLGFFYSEKIINFSLRVFQLKGVNIVFTSPFQFVDLAVNCAVLTGVIIIFPLILIQVMSFLKPALKKKEYRLILSLLPFSIILFLTGFVFGVVVMRWVVVIFYQKSLELSIGNFLDISRFLSQMLTTSALMGLAFQYPIVITILLRLRVIKYQNIVKQRLWAYIASLVFAILMPPTDLLSMVLLTIPLVILFEITLILNRFIIKTD
jgi:sec-independent protein translocase protein TatC